MKAWKERKGRSVQERIRRRARELAMNRGKREPGEEEVRHAQREVVKLPITFPKGPGPSLAGDSPPNEES
jgi:hypothetical protein